MFWEILVEKYVDLVQLLILKLFEDYSLVKEM